MVERDEGGVETERMGGSEIGERDRRDRDVTNSLYLFGSARVCVCVGERENTAR